MSFLRTGIQGFAGPGMLGGPSAGGGALGAVTWWDLSGEITFCTAAYQPRGAASLADSYIDLSGSGNNCGPGVAPGWNAAQGWIFTGVEWLDTGVTPVNNQTWSMIVQYTNAAVSGSPVAGCSTGAAGFMIRPNRPGNVVGYRSGGNLNVAPGLVNGNLAVAGNQGYRDGAPDGGAIPVGAGPIADSIYVASEHVGCLPFTIWAGGEVVALAIYTGTLTALQVAAIEALTALI